jgi:SH3-like domain-containing protein
MAVTSPQNWLAGMLLATALAVTAAHAREGGQGSGLAVPRFVSIKSDKVNVHSGPTRDHDITWIYTRAGLPVEITAEYENWRRVRDWEGAEGWVYHSLLSGRRTGLVRANPKTNEDYIPIYASADAKSAVAAKLQRGVLGKLKHCTGTWCRIIGEGFDGWVEQDRLWGVYPNEKVE